MPEHEKKRMLSEKTATTMPANFRSWRDTGITWLALKGVDVAKIQRRAGHDEISTTLGYVKMAEDLTGSIGEPFPLLPASLVGAQQADSPAVAAPEPGQVLGQVTLGATKAWEIQRRGRDSNPRQGFSPAPA